RKEIKSVAARCDKLFPHKDAFVNRALAIVLTHCKRTKQLDSAVHAKLLAVLAASGGEPDPQHAYFFWPRRLPPHWTSAQKAALVAWYESTRDWKGGHSFTPFLENIFREALAAYTVADHKTLLARGEKTPLAALVLAQRLQADRQAELLPALKALQAR